MPHLTLEFSDFVAFPDDPVDVLARLHQMLSEIADIPISNCKGRAYRMGAYAVGVNASDSGFVHLEIRLLAGRPTEIKRTISLAALDVLKSVFLTADNPRDLQITVEICDIERESYSKHPPGTLSHP